MQAKLKRKNDEKHADETDTEETKEVRKRLTSCTDERNILWHFEMVNPIWFLISGALITFTMLLAYMPHLIPFESMGYLGEVAKNISTNYQILALFGFWGLLLAHFLEAIYVVHTANQFYIHPTCLNFWFFQTLICGYPSTRIMQKYARKNVDKIE